MVPVTFCGRAFTAQELELMRVVAHDYAGLGVTEIARTVCELLEWKRANGGLKNHECRQLLERLEAEGRLRLPALRKLGGRGPRRVDLRGADPFRISPPCGEPEPIQSTARECKPLELALVEGPAESRLWRERMERYHYVGCRVPFGAHLRLLGPESPAGTGLPAVDLARLEDAGTGCLDRLERGATAAPSPVDRQ